MRFLIGTDEARTIVESIAARLRERGHEARVLPVGTWGEVATVVARSVACGDSDQGVVCCWTGTGVSMAANKVKGARAALCADAATATGARKWNDANVLALSLRTLEEPIAAEIIDAWLSSTYDGSEDESLSAMGER